MSATGCIKRPWGWIHFTGQPVYRSPDDEVDFSDADLTGLDIHDADAFLAALDAETRADVIRAALRAVANAPMEVLRE